MYKDSGFFGGIPQKFDDVDILSVFFGRHFDVENRVGQWNVNVENSFSGTRLTPRGEMLRLLILKTPFVETHFNDATQRFALVFRDVAQFFQLDFVRLALIGGLMEGDRCTFCCTCLTAKEASTKWVVQRLFLSKKNINYRI